MYERQLKLHASEDKKEHFASASKKKKSTLSVIAYTFTEHC